MPKYRISVGNLKRVIIFDPDKDPLFKVERMDGGANSFASLGLVADALGAFAPAGYGALSATSPIVLTNSVISHAASGISAGTYRKVTVNTTGHATAGVLVEDLGAAVDLTDAATIAIDAALGSNFKVTPTADRVFGNPTNAIAGQIIHIKVTIGGAGALNLTFDTKYRGSNSLSLADVTTAFSGFAAGDKARMEFIYDADDDKFDLRDAKGVYA